MLTNTVLQSPDLDHAAPWDHYQRIAHLFARGVRHDVVNLHCSLRLAESLHRLRAENPDMPVPDELRPESVAERVRHNTRLLANITHDGLLLTQAANRWVYHDVHTLPLSQLLHDAITSHLDDDLEPPTLLNDPQLAQYKLMAMGDMLTAALSVCLFQWSPRTHAHHFLQTITCACSPDRCRATLCIPIDDPASVLSFTQHRHELQQHANHPILTQNLVITTAELALWLAHYIFELHGADMQVNDASDTLIVSLPLLT